LDNGSGMDKEDLCVCVNRHATSKLSNKNLVNINTLGFRGEALPSIGSVSDIQIESIFKSSTDSWSVSVIDGKITDIKPSALREGTKVRVTDLFYRVPARLKFLKTNNTEGRHCQEIIKFLAMSHPDINFSFSVDGNKKLLWNASKLGDFGDIKNRLGQAMGENFISSSVSVYGQKDNIKLAGMIGMPTYNKNSGREQYLFVNSRTVRDRMLMGALRGAYRGLLALDRFPVVVLFIASLPQRPQLNAEVHENHAIHREFLFGRGSYTILFCPVPQFPHEILCATESQFSHVLRQLDRDAQDTPLEAADRGTRLLDESRHARLDFVVEFVPFGEASRVIR